MKAAVKMEQSQAIVYDASRMDCPAADYFNVDFWKSEQAVSGEATGRGSAWFLESPLGPVVLRQYLRGGWAAKLSRRHYLFTTANRSRPFREFFILAALYELGLPVPRPVAALCEFKRLKSSGAILTATVPSAQTLADILAIDVKASMTRDGFWESIGRCIRDFHDAGLWHADLNARNILLDVDDKVFLIDFDRARFKPGKAVRGRGNLRRLKRSLIKLWPLAESAESGPAWDRLLLGYHG